MRKMLLLRGAPACGKSTLIKDNNLEQYALSMDTVRETFMPVVPVLDGGGSFIAHHSAQKIVGKFFQDQVKYVASLGQTMIIDNLNTRISSQNSSINAVRGYDYDVYLLDVQGDLSDEELLSRNRGRDAHNRVSDDVVLAKAEENRRDMIADNVIKINNISEFIDQLSVTADDCGDYDRVVIVGDVQSCSDALGKAISDHDSDNTLWIFVGDLFDRGPNPAGVVRHLESLKNKVLVEGNHDSHLRSHLYGRGIPNPTKETISLLRSSGIKDHYIKTKIVDQLIPFYAFMINGEKYLVTHGGVDSRSCVDWVNDKVTPLVPDWSFIFGTNPREETYQRRTNYTIDTSVIDNPEITQFFGHRGVGFDDPILESPRIAPNTYCLESRVEKDGYLSIAVIENGSINTFRYKDDEEKSTSLASTLQAHPYIKVRDIGNGVKAYNFTRQAFTKKVWDSNTITARGLFMRDDTIVARGFNKFFNTGEYETLEEYLDKATYPVKIAHKKNGFLLLVANVDDDLVYYSKSGPTVYGDLGRNIFNNHDVDIDGLKEYLKTNNVTIALEVMADEDPHLIKPTEDLSLLAIIKNSQEFEILDELEKVSSLTGIPVTESLTGSNKGEVLSIINSNPFGEITEGYVLSDVNNKMIKVKTEEYSYRKNLRRILERVMNNRDISPTEEQLLIREFGENYKNKLETNIVESPIGKSINMWAMFDKE